MKTNDEISDEELIFYIRKKDKELYSTIIDRYETKLRAYLRRITNYSDEVDDLTQQTLVNAYINLNDFNTDKKFSSWIYRIAHNLAINWLKKKKASISLDENEIVANQLAAKIDIAKEADNNKLAKSITKAINNLPNKFKEPFILKYFDNKSYEEISDIMRMPKNTVGTMISRAKKLLRQDLEQIYD